MVSIGNNRFSDVAPIGRKLLTKDYNSSRKDAAIVSARAPRPWRVIRCAARPQPGVAKRGSGSKKGPLVHQHARGPVHGEVTLDVFSLTQLRMLARNCGLSLHLAQIGLPNHEQGFTSAPLQSVPPLSPLTRGRRPCGLLLVAQSGSTGANLGLASPDNAVGTSLAPHRAS
jgi:hypothetical protein